MEIANCLNISMKCRTEQSRLTSIAQKRIFSIPQITGELGYSSKRSCSRADTRDSNAVTEREASREEQIQDRRRETSKEVFDGIIDPTFLYTENSSFTYENHAFVGSIVEDDGNSDPFFRNTQYSPWADVSSTESEHSVTEKPIQTPENIPGDSLAEPQEFDMVGFQALNMGSYDDYVVKELECNESSYGFAISSGWSSTFFPSQIEEEPQGSMDMAARSAECKH
jgi:hypothetical protein